MHGRKLLLLAVLALSLGGCSGDGDQGDKPDELNVGSIAEPTSLDPQLADDDSVYAVTYRIYESLYDYDAHGKFTSILAADFPKQIDPKTWRIPIKEGVTFSNGEPFDADAAVYSIERIISEKLASEFAEVQNITGAVKIDDSTIEVTTEIPDYLFPQKVRVVKMLAPGVEDIVSKPTGTGPYLLKSNDPSRGAVLKANPKYWGDKPAIETVNIKYIPDPATRLQALIAGEIDVSLDVSPDQTDSAPKVLTTDAGMLTNFVVLNAAQPPLDDVRVRQALNFAIDKEALAAALFNGYAKPALCQMGDPRAVDGTDPDLSPYPYDVAKAKDLVREAGASGKTIQIMWPTGVFPQDKAMGEAVSEYWQAIGLKVDLKLVAFNPYVKDLFKNGPDAISTLIGTDIGYHHIDRAFDYYVRSTGPTSRLSGGGYDNLLSQARTNSDPDKRLAGYQTVGQKMCEDAHMAFLIGQQAIVGVQKDIDYKLHTDQPSKLYFDEMSFGG